MQLPTIKEADFKDKKVLLRADLDVPVEGGQIKDTRRLEILLPTLSHILDSGARSVLIIGHAGRPEGKVEESMSLSPLIKFFIDRVTPDIEFIEHQPFDLYFEVQEKILASKKRVLLLENLRFWKEEEENNKTLAEQLSYGQDIYVNEAFASSHREHASIVGVPQFLPSFLGINFADEISNLGRIHENPPRPLIAIVSGLKKDKLDYVEKFKSFCDYVLVGGRLPDLLPEDLEDPKLLIARLIPDKEDITINSIEKFENIIASAGTVILAGPLGKYEDPGHELGTKRVLNGIAGSHALKIAGGGDTGQAIKKYNLESLFDFISSGGGASLDFLANKTLPGIEAILKGRK